MKKQILLLCCIVLAASSLLVISLVSNVEGKYFKELEPSGIISLPKKYYYIHFINNETPLIEPIKVTISEYENSDYIVNPSVGTVDEDALKRIEAAIAKAEADMGAGYDFSHWINAGSTQIDAIPAGNREDIVLYPSFEGVYTAMFLNYNGEIIDWCTFTTSNTSNVTTMATALENNNKIPETNELEFDYWEVHVTDNSGNTITSTALDAYTFEATDIAIYPVYTYTGDVNLIPVDNDGNGTTDEYYVGGYSDPNGQDLVVIPESVNGDEITTINANAFADYDGVHSVAIPGSVKEINAQAFTDDQYLDSATFGSSGRETVTLYYSGIPQNLNDGMNDYINGTTTDNPDKIVFAEKWDNGMGEGSRIFFLEDGKVDIEAGYWELKRTVTGSFPNRKVVFYWEYIDTVTATICAEYYCDCDCDKDSDTQAHTELDGWRPDYIYWGGEDKISPILSS